MCIHYPKKSNRWIYLADPEGLQLIPQYGLYEILRRLEHEGTCIIRDSHQLQTKDI